MNAPLCWRLFGDSRPTAVPVLMLHGFMGSGTDWQPIAELLGAGYHCLCPDLPGHGDVRHVVEGANADMACAAVALVAGLEERQVRRCALVGYSMGGRLALYLAVHYPHRFACLALESASPGIADPEERQARAQQDNELAKQLDAMGDADAFRAFLRRWYVQPLFDTLTRQPERLEQLIARRAVNHPPALAASLRGLGTGAQPSLWKHLPGVRMPVLLMSGGADAKFTALAEDMGERFPRAQRITFPECSHCPHEEAPASFSAALSAFLQNLPA